ncbi:hypothetical protein [uncultured Thiocystis sp.]|uniref:hypothetical protein n=1 Tax=uncultured Thiocystis sp. TaxID=1202134 RepID=UPI0025F0E8B4|nr:hypothetical protein [uncultured Thiocystis sp.]
MKRRFASDDAQPIAVEGKARGLEVVASPPPLAASGRPTCDSVQPDLRQGRGGGLPFTPGDRHAIAALSWSRRSLTMTHLPPAVIAARGTRHRVWG